MGGNIPWVGVLKKRQRRNPLLPDPSRCKESQPHVSTVNSNVSFLYEELIISSSFSCFCQVFSHTFEKSNGGSLNKNSSHRLIRCGLVRVGLTLLEEVSHWGWASRLKNP